MACGLQLMNERTSAPGRRGDRRKPLRRRAGRAGDIWNARCRKHPRIMELAAPGPARGGPGRRRGGSRGRLRAGVRERPLGRPLQLAARDRHPLRPWRGVGRQYRASPDRDLRPGRPPSRPLPAPRAHRGRGDGARCPGGARDRPRGSHPGGRQPGHVRRRARLSRTPSRPPRPHRTRLPAAARVASTGSTATIARSDAGASRAPRRAGCPA